MGEGGECPGAARSAQGQPGEQGPSLPARIPGGNKVETGWKLGTKMRMSDPWARPVPATSPGAQPASVAKQAQSSDP